MSTSHPPHIVHMINVPQVLAVFCHSSTSVHYTEYKPKNKKNNNNNNNNKKKQNGKSLGMRLLFIAFKYFQVLVSCRAAVFLCTCVNVYVYYPRSQAFPSSRFLITYSVQNWREKASFNQKHVLFWLGTPPVDIDIMHMMK